MFKLLVQSQEAGFLLLISDLSAPTLLCAFRVYSRADTYYHVTDVITRHDDAFL